MKISEIKATIFSGILFAIPVGIISFIFIKVFLMVHEVIIPISNKLGLNLVIGRIGLIILAILAIFVLCYCLGWIVQRASTIQFVSEYLQNIAIQLIPSLAYYKSFAEDKLNLENEQTWKSILYFDDKAWIPAFIIEQDKLWATLFIPTIPQCNIGTVKIVKIQGAKFKEIDLQDMLNALQIYGHGLNKSLTSRA